MTHKLPAQLGIGFKPKHLQELLLDQHSPGWLEVHPENYMGEGGLPHKELTRLRQDFALSLHGVGMSLGSAEGVNENHLQRLATLVERYQPESVSEHLAWSHWNSVFFNDLLPLPYTREVLQVMTDNIQRVQEALKRPILIENPSLYLAYKGNEMTEPELLNALVKSTGCGLLCDLNNIYVSCANLGLDSKAYLDKLDLSAIGEVHLAGHAVETLDDGSELRIDDHGSPVVDQVWQLYEGLLRRLGRPVATLIEWDTNTPPYTRLAEEVAKARHVLDQTSRLEQVA